MERQQEHHCAHSAPENVLTAAVVTGEINLLTKQNRQMPQWVHTSMGTKCSGFTLWKFT